MNLIDTEQRCNQVFRHDATLGVLDPVDDVGMVLEFPNHLRSRNDGVRGVARQLTEIHYPLRHIIDGVTAVVTPIKEFA